jgi:hypothetical protein
MMPAPARPTQSLDFDSLNPDLTSALQEERGNLDWKGGNLDWIRAEGNLQFVDIPAKLRELIDHCWKAASVSNGAPRNPFGITLGSSPAKQKNSLGDVSRVDAHAANLVISRGTPAEIIAKQSRANQYLARNAPYVKQVAPLDHGAVAQAVASIGSDWKLHEKLERVNAYTFRGDTRNPAALMKANGFQPPLTRTDPHYVSNVIYTQFAAYMQRRLNMTISKTLFDDVYNKTVTSPADKRVMHDFFVWRSLVENEAFHAGIMLADETLKGYISTSRAVNVAKGFAGKGANGNGFVYVTLVRGGFVIPEKGKHQWTSIFGEQEIAVPASVAWNEIFGYREVVAGANMFTGPIYIRKGFSQRNREAFTQVCELLSGKKQ